MLTFEKQVAKLLRGLGDTPDEIAEMLRGAGIKGVRLEGGVMCVLGQALKEHGIRAAITYSDRGGFAVPAPVISQAVLDFITLYDAVNYPDLERDSQ